MNRLIIIIALLQLSLATYSFDNTISYSIEEAIVRSLKRNPEIKLIDLQIKKTELDIEQKYIDVRDTDLKRNRQAYDVLQLENQKQDVIDKVYYEVQDKYYTCLVAIERNSIAKEDLEYIKVYHSLSLKNYKEGKLDLLAYKQIKEMMHQKEEELTLSQSDYKTSVLSFLLSIDEDLNTSVQFTDSIRENHHFLRFNDSKDKLLNNNRSIRLARLNYEVKKLEYQLIDRKIESKNEIERVEFNLNEAKINLDKVVREQYVEFVNRYLMVRKNDARLKTAEKRLERLKQSYDTEENRYRQGYTSKYDRDTALINYKNATKDYLSVLKDFNLSKINFFFILN